MIEQLSNAITFYFFFTASKQGKTGLSPTGKARRISDGTEFSLTITELDATDFPGIYTATLSGANTGTESEYLAFAKTADSSVDFQHVPSLWVIGKAGIENLDSSVSGVQSDTNDIQTRLPAALVSGRMDASIGATQNNAITAAGIAADAIGASELASDAVTEIANAVLDATAASHNTAGTIGEKINAAGSAGDPWSTELPGTYDPGQAGYIIGQNIDAQISDIIGGPSTTVVVGPGDCADVAYFDLGEVKPVTIQLAVTGGTFTISSCKVTLRDGDGQTVYGVDAIDATDFDTGAQSAPRAWFNLDSVEPTTGEGPMAAGTYELVFETVGISSDGLTRAYETSVVIQIA